jgi:hypothetical protein
MLFRASAEATIGGEERGKRGVWGVGKGSAVSEKVGNHSNTVSQLGKHKVKRWRAVFKSIQC